ncbi:restriction endonuclease subunit S [Helicobacter pylori]|uniref:restriction endonuclease subunit S n=1 Tax=Helicobacter pylori TaxID=210 RepID=UPI000986B734|nr:restriction endonuclease subunit S [Helicobacter pylori]OOC26349.1 restriction endonuclease subunit S [Helicobacter pylori]
MDALTTPLPKDWEAVKVEDIFEIITDFSAAGSFAQQSQMVQYTNDRTNYAQLIRTTELKNGFNNTNAIYINKEAFEFLWRVNLNSDAIILPNIGINCGEIYYVDIKKLIHKHNALAPNAILLKTKKANLKFLFYAFLDTWFQKQLINIITSSAQPKFTKTDLRDLLIPLPPLNEQIAIANILSDVDRYLCSLDALILKKESVKKALSFELLSQRKRLKGFNQAWQRVKVKDFGIIITGSTPLTQISEYWNGTISWITPTDINDNKDIFNSERKITQKGLDTIRMIPKNSVLVTCIASIGKNAILRVNGACNQQINAIIPNKDFNADFVYYLMENNKQYLLGKAGVTATYIISKQVFEEIDFFVPKDLNEQIAIANILSDLDSEIISLKNKKRQFENIKKALNHDLMSTKIRVLNK